MKTTVLFAAALAASFAPGLPGTAPASAQGLPGGASSLSESFSDWVLTCVAPEGEKRCAISHTQVNNQNRQRVLTIELARTPENTGTGVLVLPFGLRLTEGVSLSIDGTEPQKLDFSTCLPAGCIIRLDFDTAQLDQLGAGTTLTLAAMADDNGQPVSLPVSLKGFGAAFARLADLAN